MALEAVSCVMQEDLPICVPIEVAAAYAHGGGCPLAHEGKQMRNRVKVGNK